MLTAETITDEQIRELRALLGSETYAGASDDATACHVAIAAPLGSLRRVQARARCAEIINARTADEMLLAEAIAAAKARGLGWCEGALYVRECGDYANSPDEASACCALGAIYLARPDRKADRILDCSIAFGNDYDAEWRGDVMLDDDFVSVEVDPNGESLGWAFRCAMTDGGES